MTALLLMLFKQKSLFQVENIDLKQGFLFKNYCSAA